MARIGVVRGGRSLERDFSLRSGHHVCAALRQLGHDAVELDVDERLSQELEAMDAAFIALHGRDGEDGTIQSLLEALGVPYTGSDAWACQLSFDKHVAKGVLRRSGVAVPESYVISAEAVRHMGAGVALRAGSQRLGYPIVVKPAAQGSALGLSVVEQPEDLSSAVMGAFNYGDRVLLERFVSGRELAVSVAGEDLDPLPPVEIRTQSGIFDFQARVTPGGADFLCPAPMDAADRDSATALAQAACRALGVRDFARVDMIVTEDGPVVLEINPCPGLTETSLLPLSVAEAGMRFEDFVGGLVEAALTRAPRAPA